MKAKKPLLLALLILALLAVALIVPAVASGKSDNKPTAWATWGQNVQTTTLGIDWQATFSVHVRERMDEAGEPEWVGHEVMNWISYPVIPITPPVGHHFTTYVEGGKFTKDSATGVCEATLIFRFDIGELGWPDAFSGDVYHIWVLTDNPGSEMDHVELYSQEVAEGADPPDIDDPTTYGFPIFIGTNGWDCHGVQVVVK
jgi:hypothetical protein